MESTGSDPCVNKKYCPHCNILTTEQKLHLSTPSYQKKKERCEQKSDKPEGVEVNTSTSVDPSLVSVIGVAKDTKKAQKSPKKAGIKDKGKKKHSTLVKYTKSSTDSKLEALD